MLSYFAVVTPIPKDMSSAERIAAFEAVLVEKTMEKPRAAEAIATWQRIISRLKKQPPDLCTDVTSLCLLPEFCKKSSEPKELSKS